MHNSAALASTPLFHRNSSLLSRRDRVALSYDRAKAIGALHSLTADDILTVSPKYWEHLRDPIHVMDGAAATLLTIHLNLCIGTIAMFPEGKEDLLERLLAFELSGQYCLTEVGHGLDAYHLETTATLLPTGELEINTPNEAADKYMPPTTPAGLPGIAVVFARLLVDGQDRGIKPVLLVPLHNGHKMHPGITSKLLSPRGGSGPVDHALTYFRHVRVPGSSLLGSLEKGADLKGAFTHNIFRVVVGTLGMGIVALSGMRMASYIATKYSMRRIVVDSFTGKPKPIMAFSTQKIPVLTAISQTLVMDAFCTKLHHLGLTQEMQRKMERDAIAALYPKLESLLEKLAIADYVTAPIVSDEGWTSHIRELPAFHGDDAAVQSRL
ncbi:acyl-CoA dehydrogenase/oxidase [Roridomyces roridus]|uniref:Acyl-CoA dehydrogenase/oxidase n=1 Tax=Roridomyces roridus TaxID=1738132 RepID=A0AAD7BYC6_9AGAR|nr:acyl-CoA dehydrogenase/oxidase [Roridomyces roridus]